MKDDSKPDLHDDGLANDSVFNTFEVPFSSPVKPEELKLDDSFAFRCYPGIECFNDCCMNIDIILTPYDILRLARHFGISTTQFIKEFTMRYEMDGHGMPGLKMKPVDGGSACRFVLEQGCAVYENRPTACRYYALGTMGIRRKNSAELEDAYFIVKEPHCKGHEQDRKITVREYRQEQQVEDYDRANKEWLDIIVKKRSAGPTVGAPSERSFQLWFLAYDTDAFRSFSQSESFNALFDLTDEERDALDNDDAATISFSTRYLKQVLFGEMTIPLKPGAAKQRYEQRREIIERRHQETVEKYRLKDPLEGGEEA